MTRTLVSVGLVWGVVVASATMAAAASPTADVGGTKVSVAGGAYTNIGPTALQQLLAR